MMKRKKQIFQRGGNRLDNYCSRRRRHLLKCGFFLCSLLLLVRLSQIGHEISPAGVNDNDDDDNNNDDKQKATQRIQATVETPTSSETDVSPSPTATISRREKFMRLMDPRHNYIPDDVLGAKIKDRTLNVLYYSADSGSIPLQAVKLGEKPPADVFAYPDLESYEVDEADMEPLLTCSNPRSVQEMQTKFKGVKKPEWAKDAPPDEESAKGTKNKLVFVHVFKTAGSTLRSFFHIYAGVCGFGMGIVDGCSDALVASIGTDPDMYWESPTFGSCSMHRFTLRSGMRGGGRGSATNEFIRDRFDMIGGHLPLGAGVVFLDPPVKGNERPEHVRYVSFFRSALEKYVSGVKFLQKTQDSRKVWRNVVREVPQERAMGRYQSNYPKYLITPYQREAYKQRAVTDRKITAEELTAQVMTNLIEYKVIIGLTDRMSDSLELIEHFIDPTSQATRIFRKFGRKPREGETVPEEDLEKPGDRNLGDRDEASRGRRGRTNAITSTGFGKRNVAKLSTSALIDGIRESNRNLYEQMIEYVKYEQEIFNFAQALHEKQYAAYLKKTGRTRPEVDDTGVQ